LNRAQICSEVSIAYTEILSGLKESSLSVEDLSEVLHLYHLSPFEHVQINLETEESERDSPLHPDKHLWNLLLFAIHFNQESIVDHLLSLDVDPMAIQQPPVNN
jgi:hypothetical protein